VWAQSDAFTEQLTSNSRQWATRAEVLYGGTSTVVDSVIDSGYIGMDAVAVRRELHITFVDADGILTPTSARDLLAPKGTEIRMSRGLWIPSVGDYEWIPLGVFGVIEPNVRSHSEGTVLTVKGFDRVDAIRKRRFVAPWPITKGTLIEQAISDIVTSRLNVPVKITPTGRTTTEVVYPVLGDPWEAIQDLCDAGAMQAFFDPLGSLVIGPVGDVETGVTYSIGSEVAELMNVSRTIDADTTYSGVIVRAEHPDQDTITSTVWDMDPTSPTYVLGDFGYQPYGYSSSLITTQAQADAVAASLLPQVTRMTQEIEIYTVGTPGHDIGDTFTVVDPRSRTNGKYTVISATIPLRPTQEDLLRWRCSEKVT
jgi:hypothetical protein